MREAEEKKAKKVTKQGPEDGGEASGWVPVAMRDDRGHLVYDQSGCVKYHPQNGPRDGPIKKKKKPKQIRSNSPITSDYADGHQYSSDQSINENENHPLSFTGLRTWG
jgi:hypothetical protein